MNNHLRVRQGGGGGGEEVGEEFDMSSGSRLPLSLRIEQANRNGFLGKGKTFISKKRKEKRKEEVVEEEVQ